MPSSLARLSEQLFSFQRELNGGAQRSSLEHVLDAVLGERLRPVISQWLPGDRANAAMTAVRRDFMRYASAVQPSEIGRFLHTAAHTQLGDVLPGLPELPEAEVLDAKWESLRSGSEPLKALAEYFALLGASPAETARALGTTPARIEAALEQEVVAASHMQVESS
jgi:hypothetical protein